jgi:branched-chain amino acid aminotransferase
VTDGVLRTPSLATGCQAGITRALVCELMEVDERDDLTLDDLRNASEAFLTSSTRDVHPIATVDGVALPAAPGPCSTEAARRFRALQARTLDP